MYAVLSSPQEMCLRKLDRLKDAVVIVNDDRKKAGQFFFVGMAPVHVLFNVDCPDFILAAVKGILHQYGY